MNLFLRNGITFRKNNGFHSHYHYIFDIILIVEFDTIGNQSKRHSSIEFNDKNDMKDTMIVTVRTVVFFLNN